ncbi:hypothetical protein [Streptomyces sp. EN27]|uniref:hypothetical protein n=1 Tax=Streptomyces sp. EN27 TaxID=211464 RepID=UPI000851636A|nr:hypothetical protein [Streptomyces sp. EN27]
MDTQQVSAPPRPPSAGVVHINIRLTDGYTIISNRLSQHRGLSLLAIGLSTYIQSLPDGWRIGVKALAARFPESEARIAAALRELEEHGFLRRTRVRAGGGKLATRTESYNHPEAATRGRVRAAVAAPVVPAVPAAAPVAAAEPVRVPAPEPVRVPVPEPVPASVPVDPVPGPRLVPTPTAPRKPRLPLPAPQQPTEALYAAAADLLAGLPKTAPLFLLSEEDVRGLVPGVAAWLERGARPDAVRAAITDDPPAPLRHPAKLLRHRLATLLPPPLPAAEPTVPLQNCDDCDRAFRSSVPGCCRGCRDARAYVDEPCLISA